MPPPFRPTPRHPQPPSPPPPGGLGQVPYPFPYIERPLPFGQGQVPPSMGGSVPSYPMWAYPSGGSPAWNPGPWYDQFKQDLIDSNTPIGPATKRKLYDLYKARGLPLPSGIKVKFNIGGAANQAKQMITARETARGMGNLQGAGQVGTNMGVDFLNDYLNRLSNPGGTGTPSTGALGGTAVLPFPGAIDPASILNLGAQHLMGGETTPFPGLTIPGRQ